MSARTATATAPATIKLSDDSIAQIVALIKGDGVAANLIRIVGREYVENNVTIAAITPTIQAAYKRAHKVDMPTGTGIPSMGEATNKQRTMAYRFALTHGFVDNDAAIALAQTLASKPSQAEEFALVAEAIGKMRVTGEARDGRIGKELANAITRANAAKRAKAAAKAVKAAGTISQTITAPIGQSTNGATLDDVIAFLATFDGTTAQNEAVIKAAQGFAARVTSK